MAVETGEDGLGQSSTRPSNALWERLLSYFPRGQGVSEESWRVRHRVILWILWAHIPFLVAFGIYGGLDRWVSMAHYESFGYAQTLLEGLIIALFAGIASWPKLSQRLRSASAAVGLITCSAVLTQFSGGFIEAHFHFFVILGLLAIYEDWVPFLLAIGYVLVHHGTVGTIAPGTVYNHPAALAHPWRWAGIHAVFIASLSACLVVGWNVTEKARAQVHDNAQRLAETVALQEATMDSTADGIVVIDQDGHVVDYNQQFLEMWRIPERLAESGTDEALIEHVTEQIEDPQAFLDRIEQLYATPEAESQDTIRFKDGRVFERFSQPHQVGGEIIGRVWSFQDVTDHVRAREAIEEKAQQLETNQKKLERANEDLRHFAHAASHDLKEPVRMIVSYARLLEQEYGDELDEDAEQYIDYTVEGAQRLHALVDGLLKYSRVDTRAKPHEPVNLNAVLEDVCQDLSIRIDETNATVHWEDLPVVEGERSQLGQVFQNLISNALKFSKEDNPPQIQVTAQEEGDQCRIHVEDNGIGIAPEYKDKLFTLFKRGQRRDDFEGQGIGLAVCKKIIERHGGTIDVEGTPGDGAIFTFDLPIARVDNQEPMEEAPSS